MASNQPGSCCATGSMHLGAPTGEIQAIDGVNTYIAFAQDRKSRDEVLIFLSDIFGISNNSQLLADDFAANGYLTILPDLFDGDQISLSEMKSGSTDVASWLSRHKTNRTDVIVAKTLSYARDVLNAKRAGAIGYCFGGKVSLMFQNYFRVAVRYFKCMAHSGSIQYVCRFLKPGQIDVGYTAHPSYVTHDELSTIGGPLSIAASSAIDKIFTTSLRNESESILAKTGQPWQMNIFSHVDHGFGVRADLEHEMQRFAKEQAFCQAIGWFVHYL
ncbi:Dienelactone hydrolase family protein [Penicillium atrosanguineum]|nr:Dienelactone hydrolase family protein [Penicillium atrosanguineum]